MVERRNYLMLGGVFHGRYVDCCSHPKILMDTITDKEPCIHCPGPEWCSFGGFGCTSEFDSVNYHRRVFHVSSTESIPYYAHEDMPPMDAVILLERVFLFDRLNSEAQMALCIRMSFSEALVLMKYGHKVARKGWNGKGMWLAIQDPDQHSKMKKPYIYMRPVDGEFVPWLASQSDMLAEDWVLVE